MSLTTYKLIKYLSLQFRINHKNIKKFINIFFQEIIITILKTKVIKLPKFGNFFLYQKKYFWINPKTKKKSFIKKNKIIFRASKKLKLRIQQKN